MRPVSFPTGVASIKDAPCLYSTLAFPTKLAAAGKMLVSTLSKHQQPSHPSRASRRNTPMVSSCRQMSARSWQLEGVRDVGQARPLQDLKKHLFTKSSLFRRPEPQTPTICFQSARLCQGLSSWVWPCFGQGTFGELLDFWSLAELPCLAPATQVFSGRVPRGPLCPAATCCWSAAMPQSQSGHTRPTTHCQTSPLTVFPL